MSERMEFKMQRLSLRERRDNLELRARENLTRLRKILNPAIPIADIQEWEAISVLTNLSEQIVEMRGIEKQIGILNAELDG